MEPIKDLYHNKELEEESGKPDVSLIRVNSTSTPLLRTDLANEHKSILS